ncbi:CLUMA_CG007085, isoform A [Clunio marinus]|uniref:CLUMA_CG007085, isoform A n=1 Tax=Clunio marinus TaxID=568069 RepID=A0A1J1HZM0_9DIPT|nr:CLUMA_CG007085, isoform A [Clunio marinus]
MVFSASNELKSHNCIFLSTKLSSKQKKEKKNCIGIDDPKRQHRTNMQTSKHKSNDGKEEKREIISLQKKVSTCEKQA